MSEAPSAPPVIAYFVSRFPKITETFILKEILELERLGATIELFALVHEHEGIAHPESAPLDRRAHYGNEHILRHVTAQAFWLIRRPRQYVRMWATVLRGHIGSPPALVRAIATTWVAASWARDVAGSARRIHAHWATWPALAAWVTNQLTGIPYSFTVHAHDLYVDRRMLPAKVAAAEFVVSISELNRRLIATACGPQATAKTLVVHCGADLEQFSVSELEPRQGEPVRLLCVAALEDYKGHRYLIDACAILASRGIEVALVLVGDGPERSAIETQVHELGLDNSVKLEGRRSTAEIGVYLQNCDMVVLPSIVTASGKMEGIPVALMEAMASGRPVIATATSGVGELVRDGETGLLVTPGDPEALAKAVVELSQSPALATRLALAGRQLVEEEFDLRANAKRLFDLFVRGGPPNPLDDETAP